MKAFYEEHLKNVICWDWLNFTSFVDDPNGIIALLGLQHIKWTRCNPPGGLHMYRNSLFFGSIYICWGLKGNFSKSGKDRSSVSRSNVCVSMSGSGCRTFENFSKLGKHCWRSLFLWILSHPDDYNITRVDCAYDDFEGLLDLPSIMNYCYSKEDRNQNLSTLFASFDPRVISNDKLDTEARTMYFGSQRQSNCYMRVYDKAVEQHVNYHWVRWEISLKKDNAFNFVSLCYSDGENIGKVFCGLILHYIRFIYRDLSDVHNGDYVFHDWYLDFIGNVDEISVSTKHSLDYNLDRASKYAIFQFSSAAALLIAAYGKDGFFNMIRSAVLDRASLDKYPKRYNKAFNDFLLSNDLLFLEDDHAIERLFNDPSELEYSVFDRGVKF